MEPDHIFPPFASSFSHPPPWPAPDSSPSKLHPSSDHFPGPSLDLQLSISMTPLNPPSDCILIRKVGRTNPDCVDALKWQAAEQIRMAKLEKVYAERVREFTRREMELAQAEFTRARIMWERAREEVERAEEMKARASREIGEACMEITCHSCRNKFLDLKGT